MGCAHVSIEPLGTKYADGLCPVCLRDDCTQLKVEVKELTLANADVGTLNIEQLDTINELKVERDALEVEVERLHEEIDQVQRQFRDMAKLAGCDPLQVERAALAERGGSEGD